ncbi:YqjF family protein [Natrialba asiatica]|uniref:DUF2071 domain-containing protein n=1 Tax=Natrialba asiatica (strain ATCC 700177 / DSM 12278 / JCM 9576 / FERM P-10747 / NBRC 102637 / 172P1) TaxID=29540 RepID=M0AIX0_NATA1|nr:DUF2071 domain-containing protein [Natrialba asiatica]ELY98469.1 hypothetical protein C481_17607 [Natrialba asiatica DSM 12278]
MTLRHGLFVNWPIDPERIRPHVPSELTVDTRDGTAWLSVLPFVLTNVGFRGTPASTRFAFAELNVRTYVTYRGDPGLYFFSVDVGQQLLASVAGWLTRLPVFPAKMHVGGGGEGIRFSSRRLHASSWQRRLQDAMRSGRKPEATRAANTDPSAGGGAEPPWFAATYRPTGPVETPDSGTLEHWLTERRRFYAPNRDSVLVCEVAHDPWPLQPAEATITENTMFDALGLAPTRDEPLVYYCDELEMTGSIPRRL